MKQKEHGKFFKLLVLMILSGFLHACMQVATTDIFKNAENITIDKKNTYSLKVAVVIDEFLGSQPLVYEEYPGSIVSDRKTFYSALTEQLQAVFSDVELVEEKSLDRNRYDLLIYPYVFINRTPGGDGVSRDLSVSITLEGFDAKTKNKVFSQTTNQTMLFKYSSKVIWLFVISGLPLPIVPIFSPFTMPKAGEEISNSFAEKFSVLAPQTLTETINQLKYNHDLKQFAISGGSPAIAYAPVRDTKPAGKPLGPVDLAGQEKLPALRSDAFAIIVGIDYKNRNDIPPLSYAAKDAGKIYDILSDARYGGIPKENIIFLSNEKATRNEIIAALRKVKTWDGYVYFYFSGHGAPKTSENKIVDAMLVPYDVIINDPESLEETSIKMSYLQNIMDSSNAKGVLFAIDACFSGSGKSIVAKGGKPLVGVLETAQIIKPKGTGKVIITSSALNQQSWEEDKVIRGGIFTHYLIEGLKGSGSKDVWVHVNDVGAYLKSNVVKAARKLKGVEQDPQVFGSGNFEITHNWDRLQATDTNIARTKLKKAFEQGYINADQLKKALNELKSSARSKTLDSYLEDKIDAKSFGELY